MNILPTSHFKDKITISHELVFGKKVDYRVLFPMFSVAYLKREWEQGDHHRNKHRTKSLKCIIVGSDPKTDGFQFYHPPSKQLLTGSNGHLLDTFLPAGPQFGEQFDGNFVFNNQGAIDMIHRPLTHEENKTVFFHATDNTYIKSKVISTPIDEENEPYSV